MLVPRPDFVVIKPLPISETVNGIIVSKPSAFHKGIVIAVGSDVESVIEGQTVYYIDRNAPLVDGMHVVCGSEDESVIAAIIE